MRLILTKHTRERMQLRNISERMILDVLLRPDKRSSGYFGRRIHYKKVDVGVLKIVYTIENDSYIVISVIWHKLN